MHAKMPVEVPIKVDAFCFKHPGVSPRRLPQGCARQTLQCSRACERRHFVRPEKLQNESSPNFSNFRPEFCPRILLRIFPEYFEDFSCFVSWETETRKNSPKIPAIFQCKIPRQTRKNIHKILLESRQSNILMRTRQKQKRATFVWNASNPTVRTVPEGHKHRATTPGESLHAHAATTFM